MRLVGHAREKSRQMRGAQSVNCGFVHRFETAWGYDAGREDRAVGTQRELQDAIAFQPGIDELLGDDQIAEHDGADLADIA